MATLNTTLRWRADVGSEKTAVTYTVDKTITEGGLQKQKITGTSRGAGTVIAANATIASGTYLIVRNMDATKTNYIIISQNSVDVIKLAGGASGSGDFAILPLNMGHDVIAHSTAGTEILEFATYEV
tara:strand:+ start:715 stop:1095 length:381 start_codon:yes stop_codon:yes gene_type:complete